MSNVCEGRDASSLTIAYGLRPATRFSKIILPLIGQPTFIQTACENPPTERIIFEALLRAFSFTPCILSVGVFARSVILFLNPLFILDQPH